MGRAAKFRPPFGPCLARALKSGREPLRCSVTRHSPILTQSPNATVDCASFRSSFDSRERLASAVCLTSNSQLARHPRSLARCESSPHKQFTPQQHGTHELVRRSLMTRRTVNPQQTRNLGRVIVVARIPTVGIIARIKVVENDAEHLCPGVAKAGLSTLN